MSAPSAPLQPAAGMRHRWWWCLRRKVLDVVYPRVCFGCETPLEPLTADHAVPPLDDWLCRTCQDELPVIQPPVCRYCGEPFSGALTREFSCWNCEGRDLAFDFAISAYRAEGHVREWVHHFKYHHQHELRGLLGALLRQTLEDPRLAASDLSGWLLVPVPLHPWREMMREYNQSWELCRELSRATGIPAANLLRRVRRTHAQAGLDRARRLRNLRGAFALRRTLPWRARPDLTGSSILLVDDVLTTGSTCHECARVLRRQGGAEKVVVITAARG